MILLSACSPIHESNQTSDLTRPFFWRLGCENAAKGRRANMPCRDSPGSDRSARPSIGIEGRMLECRKPQLPRDARHVRQTAVPTKLGKSRATLHDQESLSARWQAIVDALDAPVLASTRLGR